METSQLLNIPNETESISELNISYFDTSSPITTLELLDNNWQSFLIVLYSLTAALSFVGNVVAIWVLMSGKRSSRELRMFLVNLSLSDITMAIFSIPFTYTDFMLGRWVFMPQFCPVVQFMQLTSVFVSVYTLTAIGIDRYIAIMYPLATSRMTKSFGPVIVAVIWAAGIGLGFVTMANSVAEPFNLGNETYYDCKETWTQESGRIYTCVIFIITFALPMIILLFVYGSVSWKMFRHSAPGNADVVRDEAQHNAKIKIIKMLATIVILFAICWIPIHVINLLVWFSRKWLEDIYQTEFGYKAYVALTIASHWLSMANSFVNPIIYCFMSDNFRTDLRFLASKWCSRRKNFSRSGISGHCHHGTVRSHSSPHQLTHRSVSHSASGNKCDNDNVNDASILFNTEVFSLCPNGHSNGTLNAIDDNGKMNANTIQMMIINDNGKANIKIKNITDIKDNAGISKKTAIL